MYNEISIIILIRNRNRNSKSFEKKLRMEKVKGLKDAIK